jgi:exosortase A
MRAQDGLNMAESWGVRLLLVAVTIGAVLFAQHATYIDMAEAWGRTTAYNHCFVIPFISLFVAWKERYRLLATRPSVSWNGVGFVALSSCVLFLGTLTTVNALQHLAAIGLIVGVLWALLGNSAARTLWFPLIYLFFMVPEGEFLVPYLQDWTAFVVVKMLRWTGMPVFIEGRFLQIPSGAFTVAQACSGLNYLLASLAVGSLFAYFTFQSVLRRLVFMTLAILVPLVANGIRAYGIILIAHYSDYRYAMGVDHFIYGGVFFALIVFTLFAIGQMFSDRTSLSKSPTPARADPWPQRRFWRPVSGAVLVLVLSAAPRYGEEMLSAHVDYSEVKGLVLPELQHWNLEPAQASVLGSEFPGAVLRLSGEYLRADGAVPFMLQAAVFQSRGPGSELVTSSNVLFDRTRWRFAGGAESSDDAASALRLADGFLLRAASDERAVFHWYQIGGLALRDGLAAKLVEAWLKLTGDYTCSLLVVADVPRDTAALESKAELTLPPIRELQNALAGLCPAG